MNVIISKKFLNFFINIKKQELNNKKELVEHYKRRMKISNQNTIPEPQEEYSKMDMIVLVWWNGWLSMIIFMKI